MTHETNTICLSVAHPLVHTEALHVAAASGKKVRIHTSIPQEAQLRGVEYIVADEPRARDFLDLGISDGMLLVAGDADHPDADTDITYLADIHNICTLGGIDFPLYYLPSQAEQLLHTLTTPPRSKTTHPDAGLVIGVSGVIGGVGASTVAALMCHRLDRRLLYIDCDPTPGAADLLFGVEETSGVRWGDFHPTPGMTRGVELEKAVPHTASGIGVLGSPPGTLLTPHPEEILAVINAAAEDGITVVCDLGVFRHIPDELVDAVDIMALVVPSEVRGLAAAHVAAETLTAAHVPTVVVSRSRAYASLSEDDLRGICPAYVGDLATKKSLARAVEIGGLQHRQPHGIEDVIGRLTFIVNQVSAGGQPRTFDD